MPVIRDFSAWSESELASFLDEGRLECPHCGLKATPEKVYGNTAIGVGRLQLITGEAEDKYPAFSLTAVICAGCGRESLFVRKWRLVPGGNSGDSYQQTDWRKKLYPNGRVIKQFPSTPASHLKSYHEACLTLDVSPAASACMSRRCLQGILTEQGYKQKNLAMQVDCILNESDPKKVLPSSLHEAVDVIRNFGNFGAHPITDFTTLQIIDVEEGEAEWCIELIEQLLDHYYERPAATKAKLAAANFKIKAGGKPTIKS